MKKIIFLLGFLFSIVNLYGQELSLTDNEKEFIKNNPNVSIGVVRYFSPFSYKKGNKMEGLSIDILEKISKLSGLKFQMKDEYWSRIYKSFRAKELDMIAAISYNNPRKSFTIFSESFYDIPTYVFGLKDDTSYNGIASLEGKTVAITKNIFYKSKLKKLGINVKEYKDSKAKARAVENGEADYFISTYISGKNAIRKENLKNVEPFRVLEGYPKEDLRFGIAKEKKVLASIINKSLAIIYANNYKALVDKWITLPHKEYVEVKKEEPKEEEVKADETTILEKEEKELRFCINPDFKPFSYLDDINPKGLSIDILNLFSQKLDRKTVFIKTVSQEESIQFLKDEKCDILPAVSKMEQIEDIKYSKPYFTYPFEIQASKNFVLNSSNLVYQLHMGVRSDDLVLLEAINKTLDSIEEKTITRINQTYFLDTTPKVVRKKDNSLMMQLIALGVFVCVILLIFYTKKRKYIKEIEKQKEAHEVEIAKLKRVNLNKQMNIIRKNGLIKVDDVIDIIRHQNRLQNNIPEFKELISVKKQKEEFCVNETIRSLITILNPVYEKDDIEIYFDNRTEYKTEGYRAQLVQSLINIMNSVKKNIKDKMYKDGLIKLDISSFGNYIYIDVEDNSGSVSKEEISKVFESGKGVSCLHMTKMVIEDEFDGEIKVNTTTDGIKFTIKLLIKKENLA
jgi:ABC-type amino acid transport substrate-binding protein